METVALLEDLLGLLKTLNETIGVPGESLSEKNVLQNESSDPNKKVRVNPILSSSEIKRTTAIATLFAKVFFDYKKKTTPDTALKTSTQKIVPKSTRESNKPIPPPPSNKPGLLLAGLLALLGGGAALITGLLSDGPFKGALKILSKVGIKGGIKMLLAGADLFLKTIGKFIAAPFKMASKFLGKGVMGKLLSALKPLAKILKKIPLIGSIISIGFAISRFQSGQPVRGVIDVLSALTGLLYLIPGGAFVAFPLSVGLDVLNAWMDYKMSKPENKGRSEMDILKDMMGSIGKWISDNALYLPIIGGFKRWGMSFDQFKSGNIMEGLKQFGLGLFTFVGGGPIIKGIELIMGFFNNKEKEGGLSPDGSWFSRFKGWLKKKLKDLPYVLRKPLEWFGILDEEGDTKISWEGVKDSASKGFEKVSEFTSSIWESITDGVSIVKDSAIAAYKWSVSYFDGAWDEIKTTFSNMFENIKSAGGKIKDYIIDLMKKVGNWIKNLWPFGKDEQSTEKSKKPLTDAEKLAKAKAAGYENWEDYKNADWEWRGETPEPTVVKKENSLIPIIDSGNQEAMRNLALIEKDQLRALVDIRSVTMEILKQIKGGIGGGGNSIIPMPSQQSNGQEQRMIPLTIGRGEYGKSPYALS